LPKLNTPKIETTHLWTRKWHYNIKHHRSHQL